MAWVQGYSCPCSNAVSYDVCGRTLALFTFHLFSNHFNLILLLVLLQVMNNKKVPPYNTINRPIVASCMGLCLRLCKMNANKSLYIIVDDKLK